jgi:predicted 3-demethylubiquinone-9 3-methyltransferase (glyoxalase superfamily)
VSIDPKVTTCLWFDSCAEEAAVFYTSLLPDSAVGNILRPAPDGPATVVEFTLCGVPYQALNGGPRFMLSEAVSIVVVTEDQAETDRLWAALTADGGEEGRCAWLKDRFWPLLADRAAGALHADRVVRSSSPQRAMDAMLTMQKIDIAALEAAYAGE